MQSLVGLEASRLALALSGMEWEDVEIDGNTFQKMRQNGLLPWDMLPVLETDQGMLAESSAILRFAGEKAGLLPEDAFMRAKVNEFWMEWGQLLEPWIPLSV